MSRCTVWVAYNSLNECFASHEGAQEAMEGLSDNFSQGDGIRVVELTLTLPSAKPICASADIPDREGQLSIVVD